MSSRSENRSGYGRVCHIFLRLLALIYLAAFASFGVQAIGLIGADGILPLADLARAAESQLGAGRYWRLPTLLWLNHADIAINAVAVTGVVVSVALFSNLLPRLCVILLYVLYLSLYHAGQQFMSYQWDILLLEVGFLAMLLPWRPRLVIWLYRWLLFRFMLLSGVVKLASGDPTWTNLTALNFHYETQPLPTLLAWYAHQFPEWLQRLSVATTFGIELVLPFFIFLGRRARFIAAWAFLALEFLILLTGNYNFFNLLTMLLCLLLFDDKAVQRLIPAWLQRFVTPLATRYESRAGSFALAGLAGSIVVVSLMQMTLMLSKSGPPPPVASVLRAISPLHAVNTYGLFAVMTTVRNEIVIEGSMDKQNWLEYEFKYKPGDTARAPGWMIPHQPRVDWQMWFAALGNVQQNRWFTNLAMRLLTNSDPVLDLLADNPFPDEPPTYVRARFYRYTFTDRETRSATGQWWERALVGEYLPTTRLRLSVQ